MNGALMPSVDARLDGPPLRFVVFVLRSTAEDSLRWAINTACARLDITGGATVVAVTFERAEGLRRVESLSGPDVAELVADELAATGPDAVVTLVFALPVGVTVDRDGDIITTGGVL